MPDNVHWFPAWRVSLAREIAPFLNRLDELDASSFTPGQLAKLEARERELDAMLETPVAKAKLARLLAKLDIMAAGNVSAEEGLAHARLEVEVLLKPPVLPEFAIDDVVMAFLSGARGDGRWRPKPGELRQEAQRLCEPLRKELHDIRRLQVRAKQPAKALIGRERRAELVAMLRRAVMPALTGEYAAGLESPEGAGKPARTAPQLT